MTIILFVIGILFTGMLLALFMAIKDYNKSARLLNEIKDEKERRQKNEQNACRHVVD